MSTQQTQITRLKSYLKTRLEECSKITEGPWYYNPYRATIGQHSADSTDCSPSKKAAILLHPLGKTSEADALFVAHARTDSPICLANTLREVEWLEETINTPTAYTEDNEPSYFPTVENARCIMRLNEILDAFKEVLG